MDLSALADDALLELVASGDTSALEVLYDRYAQTAYNMLLRILGQREVAEDMVQETFWRIWKQGTSYAGRGSVAAWIFRIARNLGLDELRRRRVRPQSEEPSSEDGDDPLLGLVDPAQDVPNQIWVAARSQTVRRVLEQLPDVQRQAIELAYFHGLTQQQIAATLGAPLGTIKTRVRLGVQKLQVLLQAEGISEESL